MNTLLIFDDSDAARDVLRDLREEAGPEDRVTVIVPVIVPSSLPVDVPAGDVWRQVCRAEVRLAHAREIVGDATNLGAPCQYVRIQAYDLAAATVHGARCYDADTILFPEPRPFWERLAARHRVIPAILQHAPCGVRVITATSQPHTDTEKSGQLAPETQAQARLSPALLAALRIVAVNPAARRSTAGGSEGAGRQIAEKERPHAS